jgi:hypothetical protein
MKPGELIKFTRCCSVWNAHGSDVSYLLHVIQPGNVALVVAVGQPTGSDESLYTLCGGQLGWIDYVRNWHGNEVGG